MPKSYETPRDLRKKLTRSTTSRDLQKDKLRVIQYDLKKNKICLSAMTTSRDKWRLKDKENKILIKNLKHELSDIIRNHDQLIVKLESIDASALKKNRNLIS